MKHNILKVLLIMLLSPFSLNAAVIVVNTTVDANRSTEAGSRNGSDCSFREAIIAANQNASIGGCVAGDVNVRDEIQLQVLKPIILNEPVYISSWLSIRSGNGFDKVEIKAKPGSTFEAAIINVNVSASSFFLEDVKITGARNSGFSGALAFTADKLIEKKGKFNSISISNNIFEDNQATEGAAIWFNETYATSVQITGNVFTNNYATGSGGAIYGFGVTQGLARQKGEEGDFNLLIADNRFEANRAGADGGAIHLENSGFGVRIKSNQFSENTSIFEGGALVLYSAFGERLLSHSRAGSLIERYEVFGNSFFSNQAGLSGGAILKGSTAELILINNTFAYNYASDYGGAMTAFDSSSTLLQNTFVSNGSTDGGHFYTFDTDLVLAGNLFADVATGDSCSNVGSTLIDIKNNATDDGGCAPLNDPTSNTLNNPNLITGFSVKQGLPAFRLAPFSAAVDHIPAADCLADNAEVSLDQWGLMRPLDGDNDSVPDCDVGAVESIKGSDLIWFNGF